MDSGWFYTPVLDVQLGNASLALSQDDFAVTHKIGSGAAWAIQISR